mmetsp:Transcript_79079/g.205504  ORF Transcript_79079/g.205504 Transcript_79079/m.205504 type:complete len:212 (+) Transcript_79079:1684-2319(+)
MEYPKPKVLIVPGRPSFCSWYSFRLRMTSSRCIVWPSVNNMMWPMLPIFVSSLSVRRPASKPFQICVPPPARTSFSFSMANVWPASSISNRVKTTWLSWLNNTSDSRSAAPNVLITVRRPCLAISNKERPCLSVEPDVDWIVASVPMEPETSMTQQMSTGARSVPFGGSTVNETGVPTVILSATGFEIEFKNFFMSRYEPTSSLKGSTMKG